MEVLIVADIPNRIIFLPFVIFQACAVISLSALTQRLPLVSMVTI